MTISIVTSDSNNFPRIIRMQTDDTIGFMQQPGYLSNTNNWRNPQNALTTFFDSDLILARTRDCSALFGLLIEDGIPRLVMRNPVGMSTTVDLLIDVSEFAGNAKVLPVIAPHRTSALRIREIAIGTDGTAFSGGGGNRSLTVGDGGFSFCIIPSATLQAAPVNARWGTTDLPYQAGRSINSITVPGQDLFVKYTGGTTDYTTGKLQISITFEMAQC